jgi:hypothetical protein
MYEAEVNMSAQMIASELLVDLSLEEQQLLSGGRRNDQGDDYNDDYDRHGDHHRDHHRHRCHWRNMRY